MDDRDRYEEGMKVRRSVLGDAHVDRSIANRNEFNSEISGLHHPVRVGRDLDAPGSAHGTHAACSLWR